MFKKILSLAVILSSFAAVPSLAQNKVNNPLIRNCYTFGGEFWIYNLNQAQELPSCRFEGMAVGALDFFLYTSRDTVTSIRALSIARNPVPTGEVCGVYQGQLVLGVDDQGEQHRFCMFKDKSFISERALKLGKFAPEVAPLVKGLEAALQ
ncbi:MAG: hypothetical protein ACLGGX_11130 [Bdellovibrionia bacterium]